MQSLQVQRGADQHCGGRRASAPWLRVAGRLVAATSAVGAIAAALLGASTDPWVAWSTAAAAALVATILLFEPQAPQVLVPSEPSHAERAAASAVALTATLERSRLEELTSEVARLRAAEEELLAAKRAAEAAALAKGEFLATMSHEIRTPLNGILPILELVLGSALENEVRHQVSAALQSAQEMRRIVNDVLDYSKLDAGAVQLETASLRVADLAGSVCTLMRRSAETKQLRLELGVDGSVPPVVRGDALRLRQVLTNLVGNAIKFTARGEVRVEVTQVSEDRTHRVLRFAVTDTGAGIGPEFAAQLFQPFAQAESSMARSHGGTGLGLAICRRLVDAMGGKIGVNSMLGRGSTFWFTVPLLRAAGEAASAAERDMQALFLTRDDVIEHVWSLHFAALGIRATRMTTAYEVLTALRTAAQTQGTDGVPQLVVIDLGSASRTAASLTRPLFADPAFASTRILLLGQDAGGLVEDGHEDRVALAASDLGEAAALKLVREFLARGSAPEPADTAGPVVQVSVANDERFDGLRALLVDDIPINLYAGQRSLEKLGVVVTRASGGREAIELMRTQPFDIVLMDCQMPDVDGFTAARVHRLHEKAAGRRRVPILAVTANAMPGDRERCLEAGMDDHLAKPIELASLARLLARWTPSHKKIGASVEAAAKGAETAAPASAAGLPVGGRPLPKTFSVARGPGGSAPPSVTKSTLPSGAVAATTL